MPFCVNLNIKIYIYECYLNRIRRTVRKNLKQSLSGWLIYQKKKDINILRDGLCLRYAATFYLFMYVLVSEHTTGLVLNIFRTETILKRNVVGYDWYTHKYMHVEPMRLPEILTTHFSFG